jgi:nucleosome binding factor SPN SPT16 subunit
MTKRMRNGGVIKTVEDGDVSFYEKAGWTILGTEPQPCQEEVVPVSDKVVSIKKQKKKKD